MSGGDPWVRTMDGRVTPIQLGKKDPHSDTDVCAFQCFSCRHVHSFICSLSFFRTCVVRFANALRTSVYGTFAAAHDE